MTTVIQSISSDAYVRQDRSSSNYGGMAATAVCSSSGGAGRYDYKYFNRPFQIGATIQPSFLRVYQRGVATGGSRTLTVRRVIAPWKESTLAWNNKPAETGASVSVTQGDGGVSGRVWEFDISTLLQEVSDGAPWYGLRITSNNATSLALYSSESDQFQPEVEISFSDAPQTPSVLSPSNGRAVSVARPILRFDFTDTSGDVTMQGYRLLMNQGAADEVSPDYDSGDVVASIPEHLVTFDIAAAEDWWWTVETIDGAGLRSDLSEWVNFTRTAKPIVTIDSPTAGSVTDPTPPILWTVTGGTQTAYQVFLTDPIDTATVLWTSGKVTSVDDSITLPEASPPLLSPGASYGLTVRIWDDVARESTPGDPIYTDESTTFTFDLTTDVDPVTALTVTVVDGEPGATVNWTDTSAPDSLTILVDGIAYAVNIDPADALVSGTSYSWPLLVNPRVEHDISVLRVVNGETSDDNEVETFTTEPIGIWLQTLDGLHSVCLEGVPGVRWAASELSVVRKPLNGGNPVLITQGVYPREGSVEGNLHEYEGTTLAEAVTEWEALTDRAVYPRGTRMRLTWSDTSTFVFIKDVFRDVRDDEFPYIPVSFGIGELL